MNKPLVEALMLLKPLFRTELPITSSVGTPAVLPDADSAITPEADKCEIRKRKVPDEIQVFTHNVLAVTREPDSSHVTIRPWIYYPAALPAHKCPFAITNDLESSISYRGLATMGWQNIPGFIATMKKLPPDERCRIKPSLQLTLAVLAATVLQNIPGLKSQSWDLYDPDAGQDRIAPLPAPSGFIYTKPDLYKTSAQMGPYQVGTNEPIFGHPQLSLKEKLKLPAPKY